MPAACLPMLSIVLRPGLPSHTQPPVSGYQHKRHWTAFLLRKMSGKFVARTAVLLLGLAVASVVRVDGQFEGMEGMEGMDFEGELSRQTLYRSGDGSTTPAHY